jgi:hypothetical protein
MATSRETAIGRLRPAPRWVAPVFAVLGAATVPWTVYLSLTLPLQARTHHYRLGWVGFDVLLAAALLATAYAAWRGRPLVGPLAASVATMLIVDAWFDTTLSGRHALAQAVVSAVLIELPLAVVCGWIAVHADRVVDHRLQHLARRAARLREEVAHYPPDGPEAAGLEERLTRLNRDLARMEGARAVLEHTMRERTRADQIRADQIRADQIRADQIRADQIRADQIRADQIRADQAGS